MIDSTSSGRSLTGLKKRVVIIWLVFQFSLNKMWKILKYYKKLSMSSFDLAVIRCLNRPTVVENHRWVGHPFAFVQFEWLQRLSFFCKSLSRPKRMLLIVTCQQDSEQGLYLKQGYRFVLEDFFSYIKLVELVYWQEGGQLSSY